MRKVSLNMTGLVFGRLTCVSRASSNSFGHIRWNCICSCGKNVVIDRSSLLRGCTSSCGCLKKETAGTYTITHGFRKERLYNIWAGIKTRCYNPKRKEYKNYGGKGVIMHESWKLDYLSFRNWALNNGYKEDLTIERNEVSGNYEPSNCRWITKKDQSKNTSKSVFININGEVKPLLEWCSLSGISRATIAHRLKVGWPNEKLLLRPDLTNKKLKLCN